MFSATWVCQATGGVPTLSRRSIPTSRPTSPSPRSTASSSSSSCRRRPTSLCPATTSWWRRLCSSCTTTARAYHLQPAPGTRPLQLYLHVGGGSRWATVKPPRVHVCVGQIKAGSTRRSNFVRRRTCKNSTDTYLMISCIFCFLFLFFDKFSVRCELMVG